MTLARRIFKSIQSSDGRVRLVTASAIAVVTGLMVLVLAVLPANAAFPDSAAGVTPATLNLGGQPNDCSVSVAGRLPSAAGYELRIENPQDGATYQAPGVPGASVTLTLVDDEFLDFEFTEASVFDVIIKGGKKSTHWDYDGNGGPGVLFADQDLHAPRKGANNLYSVSHLSFCYDIVPYTDLTVSKVPVGVVDGVFNADEGDLVSFEIEVTNLDNGDTNATATGVTVTDTLPVGMTFDSANPSGTLSPDGGTYTWTVADLAPGASQLLTIVLEIGPDTAGLDLTNMVSVTGNEIDPDPANDDAGSVPPVTVSSTVSGRKFHDHDTDGVQDPSREFGLEGWKIAAFDSGDNLAGSATTNGDGDYTITSLPPGQYTICVEPDNTALPPNATGVTWAWAQSEDYGADCSGFSGYEPTGYSVTLGGDVSGIDFGNHRQVSLTCNGSTPVSVTLGGTGGDPLSTVTLPADCTSTTPYVSSFDLGRSNDQDAWAQFVVFGGDPSSSTIVEQLIVWDPEDAVYSGTVLQIPTTLVRLTPTAQLTDVVFCSTLTNGEPTTATPDCLFGRSIAEGGTLDPGKIQVTEDYRFLGDPPRFR